MTNHRTTLERLVSDQLNGVLHSAAPIAGGHSGFVFRVEAEDAQGPRVLCIKLTPWFEEPTYDALPAGERVYGTRLSNFDAAHETMRAAGIAVPTLYASGTVGSVADNEPTEAGNNPRFFYQIMDLVEGVEVRTFLSEGTHNEMDSLHGLVGETLGRLHQITRAYDGWVAQSTPYATDWSHAFFVSFQAVIERACEVNEEIRANRATLSSFLCAHEAIWTPPAEFVFSHVDGFQGMVQFVDRAWHLTGIIDIEDHSFTDARFVLAGHELALSFEERDAPDAFWAGYQRFKPVPKSYGELRNFFQIYYLLDWLPGCYNNWRSEPEKQASTIRYFEEIILQRCQKNGKW